MMRIIVKIMTAQGSSMQEKKFNESDIGIAKNAKIRNNIRITGGQSRSRVSYLSMNNKMKFSYR